MDNEHTLTTTNIRRFFTQKTPISLFLTLTAVFGILLIVFGQPTSQTRFTSQMTTLSPLAQTALITSAGFIALFISRLILYKTASRNNSPHILWWLLVELVICIAIMTFVAWLASGGGEVMLGLLAGNILFATLAVEIIPYVVSFLIFSLQEEHSEVIRLRAILKEQSPTPTEAPDQSIDFYDKGGRLAFATKSSNILYIEAADNYANIHFMNEGKEDTFILHNSMKEIENQYSTRGLVRCHRGYMVNIANVKLMRKESTGFTLELNNTTRTIPVSRSYTDAITGHFTNRIE